MPDDRRISELTTAEQTSASDLFETAIPNALSSTGFVSKKNSLATLATFIANTLAFTNLLDTNAKTLIGAINELAQGGSSSSVILGTTDPTSQQGSNGDLYIKYDGTSYAVLGTWVKINDAWRSVELGGGDLDDLDDVTITSVAEGDSIAYDATAHEWKNKKIVKGMAQADYDNLQTKDANTLYVTDGTLPTGTVADTDKIAFSDVSDNDVEKSTTAKAIADLKTIKGLPAASSGHPDSTDKIALYDGTSEYKASIADIINSAFNIDDLAESFATINQSLDYIAVYLHGNNKTVKFPISNVLLPTPTTGTCSLNTTNTSSGSVSYSKSGHIVTVSGYVMPSAATTAKVTILTLPYVPVALINAAAQTDGSPNCVYISADAGSTALELGGHPANYVRFSITYMTNS